MPNWTENALLVRKKDWKKFKEVAINEDGEVDFSILLPYPPEIDIDIFYNLAEHFKYNKDNPDKTEPLPFDDLWFSSKEGEKRAMLKVFKDLNLCMQGWYDWDCEHWGTKWNACHTCIDNDDEIPELEDTDQITIFFDTAWSDPQPWFEKLSEIIPFEVECTEEGGFFHLNCESDGQGNFTIDDDTAEYFANRDEEGENDE